MSAAEQGELEVVGHYADDGIALAVEIDRAAEDMKVAIVTIHPQGVADHGELATSVLFFSREHAAKDGLNAESRKDICREASCADLLRDGNPGELILSRGIAAE